jgi:hypothetical protein
MAIPTASASSRRPTGAASGVLLGRATNGRIDWKTSDGRTLKDIQDAENE